MANKNIHGYDVEYDEESETIKSYINHMEENLSHEEIRGSVENAKHDPLGKTHLEDSHGNKVTLEYRDETNFLIRKRRSL